MTSTVQETARLESGAAFEVAQFVLSLLLDEPQSREDPSYYFSDIL